MSFRVVISFLIFFCATMIGAERRRKMFRRVQSLILIRDYLRQIKAYVSHTGMSFPDMAASFTGAEPFGHISSILQENLSHNSFSCALRMTLIQAKSSLCISDSDIAFLISLIDKLGRFGLEETLSRLELADEELSSYIDHASGRASIDGKLALVIGGSIGAAAALLFL